ncbi:DUF2949 domain-containing protein [Prochlorococcus marinus]|uniref:DUF2949 domain-containing protein n=1 Tax=Prochlorococcus marinus TaxID=1219 RepID=UPI0022B503EF|nr:DUF2949 domain-containing protein [Prochlorococcus marinus]
MILTSHNEPPISKEMMEFLNKEFELSDNAINLAIRQSKYEAAPLPIILLTYGLISLDKYQKLLEWVDINH